MKGKDKIRAIEIGLGLIAFFYGATLAMEFGVMSIKWLGFGLVFIGTFIISIYYGILLERYCSKGAKK